MADRLSPADLAKRWGVNRKTIYHLIDTGQLPAFLIGSQLRVKAEDADKYEEANMKPLSKNPYTGAA